MSDAGRRDNPAVAVAVVAGAPGLGKTALAVHAAHALRRDFPDGQLYVSLRGGSEQPVPPDEVLARFLRDLGVDGARIPVDAEERAALYRTRLAERQMLIVLDDARNAAQVRPLLPGSGSCAVIVTSRHRLSDLAGSRLIDLDVLDDAEATELFVTHHRSRARRRRARCGARRRSPSARACRWRSGSRAPGWPPVAAGRSGRSPNRLADQRRRIDELTRATWPCGPASRSASTRCPRHRAAAVRTRRTCSGCSASGRGRPSGCAAAAALVGEPEGPSADALEVLVDAHLLESPAPDRYRLHDLLRAYAAERAEADEPARLIEEAVRRLLGWYLRTADAAASIVAPPYRDRVPLDPPEPGSQPLSFGTAGQALHWCEQERANLVAATRQAASYGLHDIAWKLPVAAIVCFDSPRIPGRMAHHTPDRPGQRARTRRPARRGMGAEQPWHGARPAARRTTPSATSSGRWPSFMRSATAGSRHKPRTTWRSPTWSSDDTRRRSRRCSTRSNCSARLAAGTAKASRCATWARRTWTRAS